MSLTDQELSVLRELANGASRREAATRTYLSINTVKTHLRTAYRKLGVTNRADAVDRAHALGLLASPTEGVERLPGDPGP
jgi:DNA-binding CsgD family transcriptional regulator